MVGWYGKNQTETEGVKIKARSIFINNSCGESR